MQMRHPNRGPAIPTNRDKLLAKLVESAPDAMLAVDEGGVIVLANPQAEKLFGYSNAELVGHPIEALVPDAVRPVHVGYRERFHAAPTLRPMGGAGRNLTARRKDGGETPVDIMGDGELVSKDRLDALARPSACSLWSAERSGADGRGAARSAHAATCTVPSWRIARLEVTRSESVVLAPSVSSVLPTSKSRRTASCSNRASRASRSPDSRAG